MAWHCIKTGCLVQYTPMHTILKHPLVDHRLSYMRDRETAPKLFRELVSEITAFLAFEALKDLNTVEVSFETPVAKTTGRKISDRIVLVPILRAGMGMLDAMLHVLPYAKVGVLGMQRNEETAEPIPYYSKVPPAKGDELAIVIDPMLATGGSAVDAVGQLKKLGYRRIKFLCLSPRLRGWIISSATTPKCLCMPPQWMNGSILTST